MEDNLNDKEANVSVKVPQEVLDALKSFVKSSKRTAWVTSMRSLVGIGISLMFAYLFFWSGSAGSVTPGAPQYYMTEEKLNAVAVPGESLKAEGVPETPAVSGTFVLVNIDGVIGYGDPVFQDKLNRLEVASKEPNVKAVILHINSPGGTVTGSEALREEVLRLKKLGIKVIALYDGIAASGACYMSVDADYIIATRSSLVGSIGVIFSWFNLSGLMDHNGVKMEVFKSGKFKDMGSYARDPSPEEAELLQSLIGESFNRFVEIVMNGRRLSREEVLVFANGSVFSPAVALSYGLIDQVSDSGRRDAVIKAMELTKVNTPKILRLNRVGGGGLLGLISSRLNFVQPGIQEKITDMVTEGPVMKYEWRPLGAISGR